VLDGVGVADALAGRVEGVRSVGRFGANRQLHVHQNGNPGAELRPIDVDRESLDNAGLLQPGDAVGDRRSRQPNPVADLAKWAPGVLSQKRQDL